MHIAIPRDAPSGRRRFGVWLRALHTTPRWVGLTIFLRPYFLTVSWQQGVHIQVGKGLYSFAQWWRGYQKTWAP